MASLIVRQILNLSVAALVALALAGCGESREGQTIPDEDEFFVQSEWAEYVKQSREHGYEPVVTHWHRIEVLETDPEICVSAQETMESWAALRNLIGPMQADSLSMDIRVREEGDGTATGLLQRWGFKDDSTYGVDHRVTLEQEGECWRVKRVDTRHYCRRGTDGEGRCL